MTIVNANPEFATELVCVIPYAYWLHTRDKLDAVYTCKEMKPFYYFCNNVVEKYEHRTLDYEAAGLKEMPNPWIHHNSKAIYGPDHDKLTDEQMNNVNGVLDYSQWIAPPYKTYFKDLNIDIKPYIVVSNNYNIEYGKSITDSLRFFDIKSLYEIFNYLTEQGYAVIYKRPNNTEFALDQNEMVTLQNNISLTANVDKIGNICDYDLCEYYNGKVINLNKLKQKYSHYSYNEFQLRVFANASGFITPNGGGGILCGYFDAPVVMHVPHGKELRTNYLTNKKCYYKKLSNNQLHAVLDPDNKSNYQKVINKIKEVF